MRPKRRLSVVAASDDGEGGECAGRLRTEATLSLGVISAFNKPASAKRHALALDSPKDSSHSSTSDSAKRAFSSWFTARASLVSWLIPAAALVGYSGTQKIQYVHGQLTRRPSHNQLPKRLSHLIGLLTHPKLRRPPHVAQTAICSTCV